MNTKHKKALENIEELVNTSPPGYLLSRLQELSIEGAEGPRIADLIQEHEQGHAASESKIVKKFAVFFEGFAHDPTKVPVKISGYYVNDGFFSWNFSDEVLKAKLWVDRVNAENKIQHAMGTKSYKNLTAHIVEVEVHTYRHVKITDHGQEEK